MIVLIVAVAVLTVFLLMAVPLWQTEMQREAEEELLFRARQYVTAIGLYVKEHNNLYPAEFRDPAPGEIPAPALPGPAERRRPLGHGLSGQLRRRGQATDRAGRTWPRPTSAGPCWSGSAPPPRKRRSANTAARKNTTNGPSTSATKRTRKCPNCSTRAWPMKNILLVAAENSAETYAVQVVNEFAARGGGFPFLGHRRRPSGRQRLRESSCHNRSLSVVGIIEVVAHLWRIRGIMQRRLPPGAGAPGRRRPADRLPGFQPAPGAPPAPRRHSGLLLHQPDGLGLALRPGGADPPLGEPALHHLSLRSAYLRKGKGDLHLYRPPAAGPRCGSARTAPISAAATAWAPTRSCWRCCRAAANRKCALLLPEIMGAVQRAAKGISPEGLPAAGAEHRRRLRWPRPRADPMSVSWTRTRATTCSTPPTRSSPPAAPPIWKRPCSASPLSPIYRVNRLTYLLGRRFLKIDLYSIVNILAGHQVVAELIQKECRAERIYEETRKILGDPGLRASMRGEFRRVAGQPAPGRAARRHHLPADEVRAP